MPRERLEINLPLERLSIVAADGSCDDDLLPDIGDEPLLGLYESMLRARRFDERLLELQREGRIGTFAPVKGQEAAPGAIGGVAFTPLINPPQAAILGLGRADLSPVVSGHFDDSCSVEPRLILPVVLAFDHRLNDGADAARFVNHVARSLTDAESFALQL